MNNYYIINESNNINLRKFYFSDNDYVLNDVLINIYRYETKLFNSFDVAFKNRLSAIQLTFSFLCRREANRIKNYINIKLYLYYCFYTNQNLI